MKSSYIGVVRHDGKKVWIIPESKASDKMKLLMKPCILRPKEYACDVAEKLTKGTSLQNHVQRYNCVNCLKSQYDDRTIQKILRQHALESP